MQCFVYKSRKRAELYLFVKEKDLFDDIPPPVMKAFGPPEFVMELVLSPERKLARSDVEEVMRNLSTQGFHVQMPPPPEELLKA